MDNYKERSKSFQEYLYENLSKVNLEETKMSKFKIIIEEHISQTFEVEATDIGEAMEIAEQKYDAGEFVVDVFNAPTAKLMMAEDEYGVECTEWTEF